MRLDKYLFVYGHVKSRSAGEALVRAGNVQVDGVPARKPSVEIDEHVAHEIEIADVCPYVSRGGLKLEGALSLFGIDTEGMCALDVGASTGGFTDCLLQKGARRVFAVDSGVGQLAASILADPRVTNMEKYNARHMKRADFDEPVDIAVMDVSFISQTLILTGLAEVLPENGILVSLIKPQFEAGRAAIGKGGIVKSKKERLSAVLRVLSFARELGFGCFGLASSPILGGDGNREYIAAFRMGGPLLISEENARHVIDRENNSGE